MPCGLVPLLPYIAATVNIFPMSMRRLAKLSEEIVQIVRLDSSLTTPLVGAEQTLMAVHQKHPEGFWAYSVHCNCPSAIGYIR
jgi:hypothetical protein